MSTSWAGFKLVIVLPLSFPSTGITGMYHHSWFHVYLCGTKGSNPKPYSFTELRPPATNLPSGKTKKKTTLWSPVMLALGQLRQEDFQLSSLGYMINSRPISTKWNLDLYITNRQTRKKTNLVIKPKGQQPGDRLQTQEAQESSLWHKSKSYLTICEYLAPKTFSLYFMFSSTWQSY